MVWPGTETGVAQGLLCKYPGYPQEQPVGTLNQGVALQGLPSTGLCSRVLS